MDNGGGKPSLTSDENRLEFDIARYNGAKDGG